MSMRTRTTVMAGAAVCTLALAVVLAGCAPQASTTSSTGGVVTSPAGAPSAVSPGTPSRDSATSSNSGFSADAVKTSGSATVQKLVIVNKTVRIETSSVDAAIARVRALAARDGGDISSLLVSTSTDQPIYPQPLAGQETATDNSSVPLKASITVRVPSAKADAFLTSVAGLGRVLFQSQSAEDVTQQHVDMTARLANMKAEEARLRQLFAKATRVSDMLAIEQELTRVQGEIESMQAQIAYLENQAALATVTIELQEPTPIGSPSGTDWGVATAFTDSIRAFVQTMNGIIVLLGPVLALLVFVGVPVALVVWLVRMWFRRRRAARAATAASGDEASE